MAQREARVKLFRRARDLVKVNAFTLKALPKLKITPMVVFGALMCGFMQSKKNYRSVLVRLLPILCFLTPRSASWFFDLPSENTPLVDVSNVQVSNTEDGFVLYTMQNEYLVAPMTLVGSTAVKLAHVLSEQTSTPRARNKRKGK